MAGRPRIYGTRRYSTVRSTEVSDLPLHKKSHAKKWDMNEHDFNYLLYHNFMGIPVKKRDMNAMHPLSGEI